MMIALKYCEPQHALELGDLHAQRRLRYMTIIGSAIEA
jgi:hypothetical protein